ncbi:MAG: hypothetical protein QOJ54_678 [Aliidongia sp.]|jgi:ElaB/YqjD/DUF883 family membrane-anchored ribosome-binding protein|nr:hypothetical protein [Aliidongia sp.]
MADTRISSEMETLQDNFKQLRSDFQDLSQTIGEISRHRVEDGIETLRQTSGRATERMRVAAADANAYKDATLAAAEKQVMEHPVSSLVIAFAAGMMLGKLVERR